MAIFEFPPIETADEHGLIALGGDLELQSLLLAYSQGIFPWPISEEYPLAWFSPNPRGILFIKNLKFPQSFKKIIKKKPFKITFNKDFEAVINGCAELTNRKDFMGTWITDDIIEAYISFHKNGFAYSVEAWNENNDLVGGLYGVNLGSFVSGESMFYRESNASKYILYSLMEHLKENNIEWLDTQMVTGIVEVFGGTEIPRSKYIELLEINLKLERSVSLFI
ncbi:MAG: leucyl/phenylalanyl-tRNA--protein transferase [Bacteriovoracaceae bacterium]|jgi:leucyl/phenylalanyl-tRNA---protein transferase|nr:leucyl/phenylalanyl-tRNA--protein transferase [Bacteriovoracaceae bacterium]